ncbi:MAG: hypothetical protein L6Q84_12055 [Polyangiaceae bacterium]|nr:hypothetical protein [Polyangiaceae bacterium]
MTEPIGTDPRRRQIEEPGGGYCAPDGTIQYASGPQIAPPADKSKASPSAATTEPLTPAVEQLAARYQKKPKPFRAVAFEKKRGDSEFALGVATQSDGRARGGRASVVEAKVGVSSTSEVRASGVSGKGAVGIDNPDGSTGFHAGGGGALASVEWSYSSGGDSMSIGLDVGVSMGASVGVRDANGNGVPETCWSVDGLGPLSIGACTEDAAPPQNDGPQNGSRGTGSKASSTGSGGTSGW